MGAESLAITPGSARDAKANHAPVGLLSHDERRGRNRPPPLPTTLREEWNANG